MKSAIAKVLMLIMAVLLLIAQNSYSQIHSPTSAHTSYTGLSMTGYQGWFGTPGDGAPTVGTIRDSSLFASEIKDVPVTFTEEQRAQYIRFVEVDAATDEIISYNALVGTHDLHVRGLVGMKSANAIQISLYPNPTQGTLNITTDQGNCTYAIVNILGQKLQHGEFHGNTMLQVSNHAREVVRFIRD